SKSDSQNHRIGYNSLKQTPNTPTLNKVRIYNYVVHKSKSTGDFNFAFEQSLFTCALINHTLRSSSCTGRCSGVNKFLISVFFKKNFMKSCSAENGRKPQLVTARKHYNIGFFNSL